MFIRQPATTRRQLRRSPCSGAWGPALVHLLLGLVLCAPLRLAAQAPSPPPTPPGFVIDRWDSEDGLPQNAVLALTQTRDGYLWLGTLNGLVRFDGTRFVVFDENNTPGLPGSRIVALFEDSRTNLWIATEPEGVAVARNGQVVRVEFGRGGREQRVRAICEDSRGAVWLYSADGQLARHDGDRLDIWHPGPDRPSECRNLALDDSGMLWVGMDWSLYCVDPAQAEPGGPLPVKFEVPVGSLDFVVPSPRGGYWRLADQRIEKYEGGRVTRRLGSYPWGRARVAAACEDPDGNLVVGTLGAGVFWFHEGGQVAVLSAPQFLSHNFVLSLHADREGSLWVGTDGRGLNRVKHQILELLPATHNTVVQSVAEAPDGGIWVGSNGEDLIRWKDGQSERFGSEQGLWFKAVRSVLVTRAGRVLVGTEGAGVFEFERGRFQRPAWSVPLPPAVFAMHEDRAGRLWIGTRDGLAQQEADGWRVVTTKEGLSADFVRALAEDAEGTLWVGTVGGGLNRLQGGKWSALRRADGLPSDNISALLADADGVLWVGTDGGGLGRLAQGRWTRYTARHGLISNSIGYLLEDGQGYLWLGSNAGLQRVPKPALNEFARDTDGYLPSRVYGKADGLPISECTLGSQPAACRARDGTLWFPTINGLVSVRPDRLVANLQPPPVLIETVLVDGQPAQTERFRGAPPVSVTVPAGKERLEIQYTSLNLRAPRRAQFRYRLEGHEQTWTEAGTAREARYSRLPAGDYTFHVLACNEDGVWNETGSTLAVIVQPPFWRTWWFLGFSISGLLGAVIASVHRLSTQRLQRQVAVLRQQEALERDRARIARDIHDQLGASLTQVALLGELIESDKDCPSEVETHARQVTQTARETTRVLDEIVWTVNPSNDTLEGLVNYVCKHAQEYLTVAGLRSRFEVPPELPAVALAPEVRHNVFLAAKEAVTNIVRHAQAAEARLRIELAPARFSILIEDDGRGPGAAGSDAARTRNGLKNMRRRLEDVGGEFVLEARQPKGSVVRLTVPLTPAAPRERPPPYRPDAGVNASAVAAADRQTH